MPCAVPRKPDAVEFGAPFHEEGTAVVTRGAGPSAEVPIKQAIDDALVREGVIASILLGLLAEHEADVRRGTRGANPVGRDARKRAALPGEPIVREIDPRRRLPDGRFIFPQVLDREVVFVAGEPAGVHAVIKSAGRRGGGFRHHLCGVREVSTEGETRRAPPGQNGKNSGRNKASKHNEGP